MTLSSADLALLRTFIELDQQEGGRVLVTRLADQLGISQPSVSRRLQNLMGEGWIERRHVPGGRGQLQQVYGPSKGIAIQWADPDKGVVLDWTSHHEIDWRFPLVAQVLDEGARATLQQYLHRLSGAGLLAGSGDGRSEKGPIVIAYGSVVRADARPDADVDIVTVVDKTWREDIRERLDEVAADVSIIAPRPLHLAVTDLDGFEALPDPVMRGLRREGLIVFDGWGGPHPLWRQIYQTRQS